MLAPNRAGMFHACMAERKLPFPTRRRMAEHAFAILDVAAKEGDKTPIVLTPAIRLALCWLTLEVLTEHWQVKMFWQNLTLPVEQTQYREAYCRSRDIRLPLNAWEANARRKGICRSYEIRDGGWRVTILLVR